MGWMKCRTRTNGRWYQRLCAILSFGQPFTPRFIVTSRTPAYVGRAVLGDEFRVIRVLPLDEEQITSLIGKAYQVLFRKDEGLEKSAPNSPMI